MGIPCSGMPKRQHEQDITFCRGVGRGEEGKVVEELAFFGISVTISLCSVCRYVVRNSVSMLIHSHPQPRRALRWQQLREVLVEFLHMADVKQARKFGLNNLRVVRILRIVRLVRVIRVAKLLRFIHALRTFIFSILATLKVAIAWPSSS